jgi:hypothetical protein
MAPTTSYLQAFRLTHRYIGIFISPAVLFFAFTGAVQTFSLHETTRGSSYKPPQILVILAQIHKKQTPVIAQPRPPAAPRPQGAGGPGGSAAATPAAPKPPAPAPTGPDAPKHNPWPLKIFFLLVALSLFTSTLSGIYMAYKFTRNKLTVTLLLVLGTVIPVAMILL